MASIVVVRGFFYCYFILVFIRRDVRKNGSVFFSIVESRRTGNQVRQVIIERLGSAAGEQELIELEKKAQQRLKELTFNGQLSLFEDYLKAEYPDSSDIKKIRRDKKRLESLSFWQFEEDRRFCIGSEEVLEEVYRQLDFEELIQGTRKDEEWNEIIRALVIGRALEQGSKRYLVQALAERFNKEIPLEKVYRAMDRLVSLEEAIKQKIFYSSMGLLNFELDVLFFDVTTLYFESIQVDELKDFGYSKDNKFEEVQIVLALVTNSRGVPITYEIFPGNKAEAKTLVSILEKIRQLGAIQNVVLVGDRAMFNEANLELLERHGFRYVIAAKLKSLSKKITQPLLLKNKSQDWLEEWFSLSHPQRRFVVSFSQERAKKDAKTREKTLNQLLKQAKQGQISLKKLLGNRGNRKFLKVMGETEIVLNEKAIHEAAQWDGIHGVVTNYTPEELSASQVLEKYRGLWQIEEVFRIQKHDLQMRPIYHWKPRRIRAHILLCFLSYTLLNTIRQKLKDRGVSISIHALCDEISKREVTIIRHRRTGERFVIPSALKPMQKMIYQALNVRPLQFAVSLPHPR